MNTRENKPLRSIFLLAAELQHHSMTVEKPERNAGLGKNFGKDYSYYACDNIATAAAQVTNYPAPFRNFTKEQKYFEKYFKPKDFEYNGMAWWSEVDENGQWDHESRILALLLCAETLRR